MNGLSAGSSESDLRAQVIAACRELTRRGLTHGTSGNVSVRCGEQRFFVAFAQRWRRLQSEAALRRQIKTDIHAPGEYRSDTVRNVEAWYKAYQVVPADKLYLKPEDRVAIW